MITMLAIGLYYHLFGLLRLEAEHTVITFDLELILVHLVVVVRLAHLSDYSQCFHSSEFQSQLQAVERISESRLCFGFYPAQVQPPQDTQSPTHKNTQKAYKNNHKTYEHNNKRLSNLIHLHRAKILNSQVIDLPKIQNKQNRFRIWMQDQALINVFFVVVAF